MDQPGPTPPPREAKDSSPAGESSVPLSPSLATPAVSDYELIPRIGHGAYGDVWLARSNATGAFVRCQKKGEATQSSDRHGPIWNL
jgi:hypothetical protein